MTKAVVESTRTLFHSLSKGRRGQLATVSLLMPATAIAEATMVAAIIPFVAVLTGQPDPISSAPIFKTLIGRIQQSGLLDPLAAAAAVFSFAVLTAAALRLALNWTSQHFAFGAGHDLAVEIQHRLLHQPYSFHLRRHSSETLATLEKVDHLVFNLLLQLIQAFSALLVGLFVVGLLVAIDSLIAGTSLLLVGGLLGLALLASRRGFARHAPLIGSAYEHRIRAVQDSFGAIRDVILDDAQDVHVGRFRAIDRDFSRSRARTAFLMAAPRILVEATGLLLVAALAILIAGQSGGVEAALPLLGALALGAYRLLPIFSQIFGAWAHLASSGPIMTDVACLLRLPGPDRELPAFPIAFKDEIRLEGVSFLYPDRFHHAIRGISLTIPKGARVAITGRTGSGKSTLADLLMGLIEPTEGRILVDGFELTGEHLPRWRKSIAHVPQSVFLADASIAANIALTLNGAEPDMARVQCAARAAQLDAFIEALPDGYRTRIGENGVSLSGGQRQRLALARALYKQAPVLILDEATSALDEQTEAAVIASLDQLQSEGCTIIIIAHRISTVAGCDMEFVIDDGKFVPHETQPSLAARRFERTAKI